MRCYRLRSGKEREGSNPDTNPDTAIVSLGTVLEAVFVLREEPSPAMLYTALATISMHNTTMIGIIYT